MRDHPARQPTRFRGQNCHGWTKAGAPCEAIANATGFCPSHSTRLEDKVRYIAFLNKGQFWAVKDTRTGHQVKYSASRNQAAAVKRAAGLNKADKGKKAHD